MSLILDRFIFNLFHKLPAVIQAMPGRAVSMMPQPPGRDRFTTSEEIQKFFEACDKADDRELKAFVIIAATTGLRKGAILPRKYSDIFLNAKAPYVYVGKTKNGAPIKILLAELTIDAIKSLPSHGKSDYLSRQSLM